ncbi:hypothetical protein B5F76_11080 [Desulfovibrio sp. An276]|nr:hypothetical protein B5F76_11080 [Desulfovibrio sp. An276]
MKEQLYGMSEHRRQSITFGHFLSTELNGLLYALRTVLLHAAASSRHVYTYFPLLTARGRRVKMEALSEGTRTDF